MDINRNNYEEYFLLYADNELTDSEKAEVLMFLKQNKDLENEFRMIHHTICKPDINIELGDKSFLLKGNPGSFINERNYEEVFVLYHDNELTPGQKKETEDFLYLHTQHRNEFELIGLARLVPENAVIFPNKKKLYKKDKPGKVIPIIFWRALAAAVFIGGGLWVTQLYIQKGKENPSVVQQPVSAKEVVPGTKEKSLPVTKPANAVVQLPGHNTQPSLTEIAHEKAKLQKSLPQKNTSSNPIVRNAVIIPEQSGENLIKQSPQKVNDEEKINNAIAIGNEKIKNIPKEQIEENDKIEPSKELAQSAVQKNDNSLSPTYTQTSYVADANDNGQNYAFYDITTEEFRKTKIGSFLKKVKRVIERNNPITRLLSPDDRQVVSN